MEYPTAKHQKLKNTLSFRVKGDERLSCRMLIVKNKRVLPQFTVNGKNGEIKGKTRKDGHIEYAIHGGQNIKICWNS